MRRVAQFVRHHPATSIGALLCVVVVAGAVFAPWLAPTNPFDAASLDLNAAFAPPAVL